MSARDDDDFDVHPAPPRARRSGSHYRFAARVLQAAGGHRIKPGGRRSGASQGRGQVAARVAGRTLGASARRVVVKVRLVRATASSRRATAKHLRYIERDGVGARGEPGQAYGADTEVADLGAFQERGATDRHHFRFIVAPEDGAALGDLRPYIRQLMRDVERDLGTRTDWIAVDHFNTDNPHSHVVLRGKDERGRDLVIAPDYIKNGLRARAGELATLWLGPRTEREIQTSLQREMTQERWTRLDQALQRAAHFHEIHLPRGPAPPVSPDTLLRGRLQTLTRLGLTQPTGTDTWQLRPDWENTLRTLGERGDIIRTLQRAMGRTVRELAIFDGAQAGPTLVGRVAGKGLVDELTERGYLAVDGLDGRAHYVALPAGRDLDDYPLGAVIAARGGGVRVIDDTIARHSDGGIYRAQRVRDPEARLAQVRRLEALRRGGIVERLGDDAWKIPPDLTARGRAFDVRQLGGAVITLCSHLPIEQQIHANGATWLDRQLTAKKSPSLHGGFGALVQAALDARGQYLVEQGLATRSGQRLVLARDLLATLRERELADTAQKIQAETGLTPRPVFDGARIDGTYRRSLQLVSGRYALIDDGSGFALVPWRPVADKYLGQSLSVTVIGQRTSWDFGRVRGISR
jgi:type IV secretory pathway VirD2 relaxase